MVREIDFRRKQGRIQILLGLPKDGLWTGLCNLGSRLDEIMELRKRNANLTEKPLFIGLTEQ